MAKRREVALLSLLYSEGILAFVSFASFGGDLDETDPKSSVVLRHLGG